MTKTDMEIEHTPLMGEPERENTRQLSLSQLRPPRRVPGYEKERFLGRGAFGEVWVAVNSNNGRKVAIKYYHRRGGLDWSLLSREVEKLRYLFGDRHVVQLLDVGWEGDPPYYVMEYMENGSIEDLLQNGPLPVEQTLDLMRGIATGLVHAHGKGILHCDLKPANVMLDQDGQPRLADFGQSRLSHEHSPALGTLFYMAPEQADLKALPDARWDVYAFGALMYRLLTGEPPFRTPDAVARVQQSGPLDERLERYRKLLATAPKPADHRHVPGVDPALAAIIDRCLAVDPHQRFANIQSVLSALDARTAQRARRPLLILGGAGPLLVLLVVMAVAAAAFMRTLNATEAEVLGRTREGNRFAARAEADRLGQEVRTRWTILEHEASDPALARLVAAGGGTGTPGSTALNEWVRERHASWDPVAPASIWMVLDQYGNQRAATAPDAEGVPRPNSVNLGRYFGFRDYFHGRPDDFPPRSPAADPATRPQPLTRPHRSRVYQRDNKLSPTYVVTYSVPIPDPDHPSGSPIGVLGMSSELVGTTRLRGNSARERDQLVVLIDTRPDEDGERGGIVRHPYQEEFAADPRALKIYHVPDLAVFRDGEVERYRDPVGGEYERAEGWLTAVEPVRVPGVPTSLQDTGWLMLVQEDQAKTVRPIRDLRQTLARYGVLAIVLVLIVLGGVWLFVLVVVDAAPGSRVIRFLRKHVGFRKAGTGSVSGSGSSASGSGADSGSQRSGGASATPARKG